MRKRVLLREIARLKDENQRLRRVAEAQAADALQARWQVKYLETKSSEVLSNE